MGIWKVTMYKPHDVAFQILLSAFEASGTHTLDSGIGVLEVTKDGVVRQLGTSGNASMEMQVVRAHLRDYER